MHVQQVIKFINLIQKIESLPDFDQLFLIKFETKISSLVLKQLLDPNDIAWLQQIFRERWDIILDTPYDYTLNPEKASNPHWIHLAKQLVTACGLNAEQILIPSIKNNYERIITTCSDLQLELKFLNEEGSRLINIKYLFEDATKAAPFRSSSLEIKKLERKRAVSADMLLSSSNEHINEHFSPLNRNIPILSLREFSRIKLKSRYLHVGNENRSGSFWNQIEKKILSIGVTGRLPKHLFPALLQIIDRFFEGNTQSNKLEIFREHLFLWAKLLNSLAAEDVYYLYGQQIQVNHKKTYFLNVLLDCLHKNDLPIGDQLIGIARWLCEIDASLISNREEFDELYIELKVGRKFRLQHLKEILFGLKKDCSVEVSTALTKLLQHLESKTEIDVIIINALERIFAQYWHDIENSETDYRCLKGGINAAWIRLAQILSRHHLDTSYYSFLMPTSTPLTMSELLAIKQKKGSLYFDFLGATYVNFSNTIGGSFVSGWQKFCEIPRHVLPALVDLIDLYFAGTTKHSDLSFFRPQLLSWTNQLLECSLDDINLLYMQPLVVHTRHTYFGDVLLDCLYGDEVNLYYQMAGIADWLSKYDASFICKSPELLTLYDELHVGNAFGIGQLREILATLKLNSSPIILVLMNTLIEMVRQKEEIDAIIIQSLLNIYQQRWSEIKGGKDDYTRQILGVNKDWIRLAQLMKGANLIQTSYYYVLMPTLAAEHTIDPVTLLARDNYSLDHFIIDGPSFENTILLDNSLAEYTWREKNSQVSNESAINSNLFFNCNVVPMRAFYAHEHELLQYAHKKFHKYMHLTQYLNEENYSITLDTVDALTRLVNESLYPQGLAAIVDKYSNDQMTSAENAYLNFSSFYNQMADDERERLNQQLIYFRGAYKRFQKIWSAVDNYESCMATIAHWILQLIIEYLPERRFSSELENGVMVEFINRSESATVGISKMRMDSKRKILRDIEQFGERAQQLCVSILTYPFDETHRLISFLGCKNSTNDIVKGMFEKLMVMLESNDFTQYPDLVHSMVLDNVELLTRGRGPQTQKWLQSVIDGSFFKNTAKLYEPESFLRILLPLIQAHMDSKPLLIETFLDELLHTCAQEPQNFALTNVKINIKFTQLMSSLEPELVAQIITALTLDRELTSDLGFRTICIKYLVYRMTMLGMTSSKTPQPQFFQASDFNIESVSLELEEEASVRQMLEKLIVFVGMCANTQSNKIRLQYLQQTITPKTEPSTGAFMTLGGDCNRR